jgi:hypothetical protein
MKNIYKFTLFVLAASLSACGNNPPPPPADQTSMAPPASSTVSDTKTYSATADDSSNSSNANNSTTDNSDSDSGDHKVYDKIESQVKDKNGTYLYTAETEQSYIYVIKMENGDTCYITDNKGWTNVASGISCTKP